MRNVLFICTGNSCRSIMAEALLNHLGKEEYRAFSGGNRPVGCVHPRVLEILKRNDIPIGEPYSKSWNEFSRHSFHRVIALCPEIAEELWPLFPGKPKRIYWNIPDPAQVKGSEAEIEVCFDKVFFTLKEHIESFISTENSLA